MGILLTLNVPNEKTLRKFIKEHEFITLSEAKELGFNPMALSRYVRKEVLIRPHRGIYTDHLEWLTHPLKKYLPICALEPEAVIAGISALTYYDLTDEEESVVWISLPHKKKKNRANTKVIRPSGVSYSLGLQRIPIKNREVRIYDCEKTVVDAFKYLSEEVALKALKTYLKRKDKDIPKLLKYGNKLRKPLDKTLKAMLGGN